MFEGGKKLSISQELKSNYILNFYKLKIFFSKFKVGKLFLIYEKNSIYFLIF